MTAPWGATPDEWDHFAARARPRGRPAAGGEQPGAKISEQQDARPGQDAQPLQRQGTRSSASPSGRSTRPPTATSARWSRDSDLGICLQTRVVRAIDIDIADPVRAAAVRELVELMVALPARRARTAASACSPSACLASSRSASSARPTASSSSSPTASSSSRSARTPAATRYEWVDGDGVLGLPAEIPELTPAEFECLWQALVDAFALPDGESTVRNGMVPTARAGADDLQDPVVAWLDENGWVTGYERDGRSMCAARGRTATAPTAGPPRPATSRPAWAASRRGTSAACTPAARRAPTATSWRPSAMSPTDFDVVELYRTLKAARRGAAALHAHAQRAD
jgi:hypothetical protein